MVDTLITIGIIAFVLLRAYMKANKKAQQQAQRRAQPRPTPQPVPPAGEPRPFWEESYTEESSFGEAEEPTSYEEIPKNDSYFTYEKIEPEINATRPSEESYSEMNVETSVQNIENESEKKPQISVDMDEFYKGIIYSEILKRPYN